MNAEEMCEGRKQKGLLWHARITTGKNVKLEHRLCIAGSSQRIKIDKYLANQASETHLSPILSRCTVFWLHVSKHRETLASKYSFQNQNFRLCLQSITF